MRAVWLRSAVPLGLGWCLLGARSVGAVDEGARTPPEASEVVHAIQPGETLWRLSRRYGVSVDALVRANAIEDVHRVPAGSRIVIPGSKAAPTPHPVPPGTAPADPGRGAAAQEEAHLHWDTSEVDGLLARIADELRRARFEEALATAATTRAALESAPGTPAAAERHAELETLSASGEVAFGRYAAALRHLELALEAKPELELPPARHSPKIVRLLEVARRRAREGGTLAGAAPP